MPAKFEILSLYSNGLSSRPISAPSAEKDPTNLTSTSRSPLKKRRSAVNLIKRVGSSQKSNNTAKSIKSRQKSSLEKCLLKVHGIGETPFLMELVSRINVLSERGRVGYK